MTTERPIPVGRYEIVQDFVTPGASVRVFRMEGSLERIEQHVHHKSTQIYLSLAGQARITVDGVDHLLRPYDALAVHPGSAHGASPVGAQAILANISFPALANDDQLPVSEPPEPPEPPDLRLPRIGSDYDD